MQALRLLGTAALAGVLLSATPASAQNAAPTTYDVSTVKPAAPGKGGMSLNFGTARLQAENVTLEWIMTAAFHARSDQISGAPGWSKDKHFDITAKLTDTDQATLDKMTIEEQRKLLLALLVERFGLKYHVESRELPTYDLVPAKGGLKLTPAVEPGNREKQVNGVCDGCTYWGDTEMKAHDVDLPSFAEMLGGQLGRDTHDNTGYKGKIDVMLKFAQHLDTKPTSDDDAALLPLPQAVEQQMGIRLISTRGPVKIYTIDHLDEPTGN